MTDQGSQTQASPPDQGTTSETPPAAFYEAFQDANLKTSPSVQGFKSVEELAKGYVSLEKRFGVDPARRIDLPADPNDAAGMRAVYAKLGLPEKAEGYGLTPPDGATDADKAMLGKWGEAAHKAGLPAPFAKAAMDFWLEQSAHAGEAQKQVREQFKAEGETALKTAFGAAFDTRMREVENLVKTSFGESVAKAWDRDTLLANPELTRGLAKLVERMAEPGHTDNRTGDTPAPGAVLTPAQAAAAVKMLEGDPVKGKALTDRSHPQHKAVVDERSRLLRLADGVAA